MNPVCKATNRIKRVSQKLVSSAVCTATVRSLARAGRVQMWICVLDQCRGSGSNEGQEHLAGYEWLIAEDVRCVRSPETRESDAGLGDLFAEGVACAWSEPEEDEDEEQSRRTRQRRRRRVITLVPTTPCQAESRQTHNVSHKTLSVCVLQWITNYSYKTLWWAAINLQKKLVWERFSKIVFRLTRLGDHLKQVGVV